MTQRLPAIALNCDLGEGEPAEHTSALMDAIHLANIACGGHAGSVDSMRWCLQLAAKRNILAGAHPGLAGTRDFGRTQEPAISPDELRTLVRVQVGALARLAASILPGGTLHHVKLHGALYHATDVHPSLAEAFLDELAESFPALRLVARADGPLARAAIAHGIEVWDEAFLDRAYLPDGRLVPRTHPGAILESITEVLARFDDLQQRGGIRAIDGTWVPVRARTACVHGDSPRAAELLRAVQQRADSGIAAT